MRYKALGLLMLFVVSLSIASASFTQSQIQNYVDTYNQRVDGAPDLLKSLIGNERIDLNITSNDGSIFSVGFETQNARISRTVTGGIQNPTIIVSATEDAIERIKASADPVAAFQAEKGYGQVNIEGTTLVTKLKLSAVLSSLPVLKFFASIFFGQIQ
jgi:flagellin-like hook-associated protein FlgL